MVTQFEDEEGDEIIRNYFQSKMQKPRKRSNGKFWVSDLGTCKRYMFYNTVIGRSEPSLESMKNFEWGNRVEDVWEQALIEKYNKRLVKNDLEAKIFEDGFQIWGYTDPVLLKPDGTIDTIWEVKGATNLWARRASPADSHRAQLHGYMKALDQSEGKIIYIHPTHFTTKTYEVEFDDEFWAHLLQRLGEAKDLISDKVLPKPEKDYSPKCKWCDYQDICEAEWFD